MKKGFELSLDPEEKKKKKIFLFTPLSSGYQIKNFYSHWMESTRTFFLTLVVTTGWDQSWTIMRT